MTTAHAMGVVEIVLEEIARDMCGGSPFTVAIKYDASGVAEGRLPRMFALDIRCTDGPGRITAISDFKWGESTSSEPGFGVFMGSIDYANIASDPDDSNYWGNPRATDVGAASTGALPQAAITVEMGSLYDPDIAADAPLAGSSGNEVTLCTLTIDSECTITVTPNVARGADQGVVLEDGSSDAITSTPIGLVSSWCYPDCWGYSGTIYQTQCHADTNGDGVVGLLDFYNFRDSWGKSYPDDDAYNHCADTNRDGTRLGCLTSMTSETTGIRP